MFQIVVFPGAEETAAIEPFRQLHDPSFHEIPAHVVLAPRFDDADPEALVRRFLAFEAPGTLDLSFGAPVAIGRALVIPILDPDGRFGAVIRALRDAVLPTSARLHEPGDAPGLRIGVFPSDAELELARRGWLATSPRPTGFRAAEIVLLLEDERGLWHEVRRLRV